MAAAMTAADTTPAATVLLRKDHLFILLLPLSWWIVPSLWARQRALFIDHAHLPSDTLTPGRHPRRQAVGARACLGFLKNPLEA